MNDATKPRSRGLLVIVVVVMVVVVKRQLALSACLTAIHLIRRMSE